MKRKPMRIACVYLPYFPVQVHVRRAPHLAGKAFVVRDHKSVVACSRAAWDGGVRAGMSVVQARRVIPELEIRTAVKELHSEAIEALAESLLAYSTTVDTGNLANGPHHALYLRVPTGTRGATFGNRLLAMVSRQGFRGRVGIADDRFSAWTAAVVIRDHRGQNAEANSLFTQACTVVPRGGSAAFLAPLALSFLPLDDDVRGMLTAIGLRTIGDFAALPPPSLRRRHNVTGVDFQALARGDDPTSLVPFVATAPVVEAIELETPIGATEPLGFMLRPLFDRVCERLRGRNRAVGRVEIRLHGDETKPIRIAVEPQRPTLSGRTLLDAARAELNRRPVLEHAVDAIEVRMVAEAELGSDELDLFDTRRPDSAGLSPFTSARREPLRRARRNRLKRHRHRKSQRLSLFD